MIMYRPRPNRLGTLTAKLLGPVRAPLKVFPTDRWSRGFDRFDEILHFQGRFE